MTTGPGYPNNNPAYFPAFPQTWTIPPFPVVGQGNFQKGPIVFDITVTPIIRVPPFVAGETGVITPPTPPEPPVNDRGTFTTWVEAALDIDEFGVEPGDTFTIQEDPDSGTWTYIGTAVAAGGSGFTFDSGEWSEVTATSASATVRAAPAPKGRKRKR
jgi:hypothetical protein